jgi:hypothetical protein
MAAAFPNTKGTGRVQRYPVGANGVITKGHIVMSDAGFAADPAASATNDGCMGIALEDVDNTGGANGDRTVLVMDQIQVVLPATSITSAMVGDIMFAVNQTTFDETDTGNLPELGILKPPFLSTTSGWVYIDADLNKVQGT